MLTPHLPAAAAGLGGGLVLSILWLLFLRYFAGVVAWLTVLAANLLFVGCTILSYQKARCRGCSCPCRRKPRCAVLTYMRLRTALLRVRLAAA